MPDSFHPPRCTVLRGALGSGDSSRRTGGTKDSAPWAAGCSTRAAYWPFTFALLLAFSNAWAQQAADVHSATNAFLGSVPSPVQSATTLHLTLQDAIQRGLGSNLGLLFSADEKQIANGGRWQALSRLLPQVYGSLSGSQQEIDLQTMVGPHTLPPTIPSIAGPFHVYDARLSASAALFNWKDISALHAASHQQAASSYTYQQARDMVVLAVGNAYLLASAGRAQVQAATAEFNTAQALFQLAKDRETAGLSPQIDTLRALVELKSRQENLLAAQNDYATEKLNLARAIGLPDEQSFELTTEPPLQKIPSQNLNQSLAQAYLHRGDYRAAVEQVAAARAQLQAAQAERYPSVGLTANFGDTGTAFSETHPTYMVAGSVRVPLFQGGRVHGEVAEASARLHQAQNKLADLKEQIDYDVRTALLNLATSTSQMEVAQSNTALAAQTQEQARDRFAAGVADNIELVQAQQSVAQADATYITSLYRYNISKLSLAYSIGLAEHDGLNLLGGK